MALNPPLFVGLLIGFVLGILGALFWRRRGRGDTSWGAEFDVYAAKPKALTGPDLKRGAYELPGEIWRGAMVDPWTFSDVRFRIGTLPRKEAPWLFEAEALEIPEHADKLKGSSEVVRVLFRGPVAEEGFPLATVTAGVLSAARETEASGIMDRISGRFWSPRDLAAAAKLHGLDSPELHLAMRWEEDRFIVHGFRKRGRNDLRTLPVPEDLRLIGEEVARAFAAHLWNGGEEAGFDHEAYGDHFSVKLLPGKRPFDDARIFRRQRVG